MSKIVSGGISHIPIWWSDIRKIMFDFNFEVKITDYKGKGSLSDNVKTQIMSLL